MTREEAIALLKSGPEGVTKWNDWRSTVQADGVAMELPKLNKANLSGADLSGANLSKVNLSGADLSEADLSEADLSGAGLIFSKLRGTFFFRTKLIEAQLVGAKLRDAIFIEADLSGADLEFCDGRFTYYSRVVFVRTSWCRDICMRLLTWQKVRIVGGLQVLTKASYVMLALVPVLAGVWLGVRQWLVAAQLPTAMPSAYAQGFFAALFVALGHAVYQIRCPELVATKSLDGFAQELLAAFSSTAGDRNDRLTRALNALKELAESDPTRRHRNLVRRHGRVVWIPSELKYFDPPTPAQTENEKTDDKQPVPQSSPEEMMRVAIEEGARAEYELHAIRDQRSAIVAVVFYALAGALITWLIIEQAWKVARAAQWV